MCSCVIPFSPTRLILFTDVYSEEHHFKVTKIGIRFTTFNIYTKNRVYTRFFIIIVYKYKYTHTRRVLNPRSVEENNEPEECVITYQV